MAKESFRTPFDADDGVTQLQEDVLGLLEEAGVSEPICEQIMNLIRDWEHH